MSAHEWPRDEEGIPHRRAARVILVDDNDRVLLVRGHDADNPKRSWWFTVGGGVEHGETTQECAIRELFEETGIRLEDSALVGPVACHHAVFDFKTIRARQDEEIFFARTHVHQLSDSRWTAEERRVIDEYRWWDLEVLEQFARSHEVFPVGLCDLVRSCIEGWDGIMLILE